MTLITAPIIAITLVLLSVFVPVAFIPGISGDLFRQFAVAVSGLHDHLGAQRADAVARALRACSCARTMGRRRGPMGYVLRGIDLARDGYTFVVARSCGWRCSASWPCCR